jgi:saccharopine dehydrogenase (NADP+, L-glutamate forming)
MALTVGMTCGIAAQLLVDRHPALSTPGILAPYTKAICDPIREQVECEGLKLGFKIIEKVV